MFAGFAWVYQSLEKKQNSVVVSNCNVILKTVASLLQQLITKRKRNLTELLRLADEGFSNLPYQD